MGVNTRIDSVIEAKVGWQIGSDDDKLKDPSVKGDWRVGMWIF